MVGGRYSYTGLVISLLAPDAKLEYWDYQSRASYDLTPNDRFSIFAFGSHDFLGEGDEAAGLDLTFHRLTTSYWRKLDDDSQFTVLLNGGLERTGFGSGGDGGSGDMVARSAGGRLLYTNRLTPAFKARVGADAQFSRVGFELDTEFEDDDDEEDEEQQAAREREAERRLYPLPGFPNNVLDPLQDFEREQAEGQLSLLFGTRDDLIGGAWVDALWKVTPRITLTPGVRLDLYRVGGTLSVAPEPRLTARFDLGKGLSVTHAVGIAHQPPSAPIPLPGFSGSAGNGLQRGVQTSAGVEGKLPALITASATIFQNAIFDSTDLFGTAGLQETNTGGNRLEERTTGHTYGLELYLRRSLAEKLGGFLSYTLSRSTRTSGSLGGPSTFDRRHVINAALAYDLGRRWRLGGRVVAYSGAPGRVAYSEALNNPPRTPWFWRLDWRLEKRFLIGTDGAWWALVMEVLNTTLNEEVTQTSCYAYGCRDADPIGPVTVPSIGVEASF